MTNGLWDAVRDVEGVLEACAFLCTLSQNENKFNAAYGPVVRMHLHKTLTADTLSVIDLNNWGKKARPNRIDVPVDDMTICQISCRWFVGAVSNDSNVTVGTCRSSATKLSCC